MSVNDSTYPYHFKSKPKETIMTYGYIRVSSDKQTVENQRFEINNFGSSSLFVRAV